MLDISYNYFYSYATVKDIPDFLRANLPENRVIRSIIDNIKSTWNLPGDRIELQVAEGARIYKFSMYSPDVHRQPWGYFVYIPLQKRLDFWDNPWGQAPYIQWKERKPVFKNYSIVLDKAGQDTLFSRIVGST